MTRVLLLLAFLLQLTLQILTVSAGPPANFSIGALVTFTRSGLAYDPKNPQPITAYDCYTEESGCPYVEADRYVAFRYQIDRINADPNILPHTHLDIDVVDDQGTRTGAIFKAYELFLRGNQLAIGPTFSSPATNAALVATGFQAPLISYAASSPELTDKKQYPYFMRTCQSDASQGEAIAWFAKYQFNWNSVAILYNQDAYGSGITTVFIETALKYNITILSEQSFPDLATEDDVDLPLRRIKSSGALVIMYFGQQLEFLVVQKKAQELNMFNNDMAWFVSDTVWTDFMTPEWISQRQATPGLVTLTPDSGIGTPLFDEFAAGFVGRNMSSFPPMERYSPPTPESIYAYTIYAADIANVIASALNELFYVQNLSSVNQTHLFETIKKTDITSISGRIRFDENNERIGIRYIVNNLQNGTWQKVGVYTEETYTPYPSTQILWYDGTANIPKSEPTIITIPVPSPDVETAPAIVLLTIAAILLALTLANLCALYIARTNRILHTSSPAMLGLVCIGGAFVISAAIVAVQPPSTARCTIEQWLFNLGFQASFGAMLLKTYRLHRIYNNNKLEVSDLSNSTLFGALAKFLAFDLIILSLRTGIAPYVINDQLVCDVRSGMESDAAMALTLILIISKALMIAVAAYLIYAVRHVPQVYHESTYLGISIYNTLLIGAVWIAVRYRMDWTDHQDALVEFEAGIMLATSALTLALIFLPKWYDMYLLHKQSAFYNDARKKTRTNKFTNDNQTGGDESCLSLTMTNLNDENLPPLTSPTVKIPQSPDEIEALLASTISIQKRRLQFTFKEIGIYQTRTNDKKKDVTRLTNSIVQLQGEMDFFRQMKTDLSGPEIVQLFESRLKEFYVIPDRTGQIPHLPPEQEAVRTAGLANAYAAVKDVIEGRDRARMPSVTAPAAAPGGSIKKSSKQVARDLIASAPAALPPAASLATASSTLSASSFGTTSGGGHDAVHTQPNGSGRTHHSTHSFRPLTHGVPAQSPIMEVSHESRGLDNLSQPPSMLGSGSQPPSMLGSAPRSGSGGGSPIPLHHHYSFNNSLPNSQPSSSHHSSHTSQPADLDAMFVPDRAARFGATVGAPLAPISPSPSHHTPSTSPSPSPSALIHERPPAALGHAHEERSHSHPSRPTLSFDRRQRSDHDSLGDDTTTTDDDDHHRRLPYRLSLPVPPHDATTASAQNSDLELIDMKSIEDHHDSLEVTQPTPTSATTTPNPLHPLMGLVPPSSHISSESASSGGSHDDEKDGLIHPPSQLSTPGEIPRSLPVLPAPLSTKQIRLHLDEESTQLNSTGKTT